jgi:flagellin-like hook-associated protein FlgL
MVNLQEQLATGKRLRKPSDNPIDVANTIKLSTKHAQLNQYKRNIEDGLAVMGVASSAMQSMNEMLHRARELAVQAANGTYTNSDRMYMQQEIDQIFRQMMSVVNTQFKGNYVFNGTNTKTAPYLLQTSGSELTDYTNRTMATYGEELDISVRTAEDHNVDDVIFLDYALSTLKIGDTVQLTWSSTNADIDRTALNNIFPETFPLDTFDIRGTTFHKDVDYAVDHKTGKISILSESFRDALNTTPFTDRIADTGIAIAEVDPTTGDTEYLDIQYSITNTFQIIDGKFGDTIRNIFPGSFSIKIGDREYIEGFGEHKPAFYDEDGILQPGENDFDFSIDYETGKITIYNMDLMRDMRPEWLGGPDQSIDPDAPDNLYKHGQLQINFDYIERGTNVYGDRVSSQGDILRAIEQGITVPINIGADDMLRDTRSGNEMVGVLLRFSQALLKDDRDGIQNALDELTTMYDTILNSQSDIGARIYRFELTLQRNDEQNIEVLAQKSALEDADLAEVISRLLLAENVYQASLQAAMRVIQPSLANYM